MKHAFTLFLFLILTAYSAIQAQCNTNLLCNPADNNGQNGIMFDIVATNPIMVQSFDVKWSAVALTVNIYYKSGTHVGFETTPAAWTLLGTYSTTGLGAGSLTPMLIPVNLNVDAGCRVAFYITNTIGTGMRYTNGTAVGNTAASDANVRICEGTGKSYPFNLNFTPRVPNIRMYYNSCAAGGLGCGVLPVQSIHLEGARTAAGALLQWFVEGEGMTREYIVEGTNDLRSDVLASDESSLAPTVVWNTLATIPANGSSSYHYTDHSGYGFYRVKAVDDGSGTAYTRVVEMPQEPIPTLQVIGNQVQILEEQPWELALYDLTGRVVRTWTGLGPDKLDLTESTLAGAGLIRFNSAGISVTRSVSVSR